MDTRAIGRHLAKERASCSVQGGGKAWGQELYGGRATACPGRVSLTHLTSAGSEQGLCEKGQCGMCEEGAEIAKQDGPGAYATVVHCPPIPEADAWECRGGQGGSP